MPYYIIASKMKVMKTGFLSPFPTGLEDITNEKIAQSIKDTAQTNASFILFTDLVKAQEFAREVSQRTNATVADYYIEYTPVIEVTLKDEAAINNQPGSLVIRGYHPFTTTEKSTALTNIDKVNSYYYQQGSRREPRGTLVTLEKPLTLQNLSEQTNSNSCVIS